MNVIFNTNYPLTHLNLERCSNINVDVQSQILRYVNLRHLNLSHSTPVDDYFVTAIVENLKNLTHLNLNKCDSLSNIALKKLGQLENLEEISLNWTKVDGSVLVEFKNLKILRCQYTSVNDNDVIKVLDNLPYLEHLYLDNTEITINTLFHASNVTKYRERKLSIYCEKIFINAFQQRNEISPFLDIKEDEFR